MFTSPRTNLVLTNDDALDTAQDYLIEAELSADDHRAKTEATANVLPSHDLLSHAPMGGYRYVQEGDHNATMLEPGAKTMINGKDDLSQPDPHEPNPNPILTPQSPSAQHALPIGHPPTSGSASRQTPTSMPGAYSYTPGKNQASFREKRVITSPHGLESAPSENPLSLGATSITHIAETDQASVNASSLGQNARSNIHDMHKNAKERRVARAPAPASSVDSLHRQAIERQKARKAGPVDYSQEGNVTDETNQDSREAFLDEPDEIQRYSPNLEEAVSGAPEPLMPPDDAIKPPSLGTSLFSSSTLVIAAEVVDTTPEDMEAQIEERVGQLRQEWIRDAVQADAVKVNAEDDMPAPKRLWRCWIALVVVAVAAAVALGIILPKLPKYDIAPPTQSPTPPVCTLCPDGNVTVAYPERKLPRLTEGFLGERNITCGSLASDPLLVTEWLSRSSGECSADIQVYATYCGCSSADVQGHQCGTFCSYELTVATRKNLVTPVFKDTCGELENFYSTLSTGQCKVESAVEVKACAPYCCSGMAPVCSLCPNMGDEPSLSSNAASPFFNLTCGELKNYSSILTSGECLDSQEILRQAAGVCGCPSLACSLCGSNGAISDPSRTSLFNNYSCAALNGIIGAFSSSDCSMNSALIQQNANHCCIPGNQVTDAPTYLVETFSPSATPTPTNLGYQPQSSPPVSLEYPPPFLPSTGQAMPCSMCPMGESPPDPSALIPSGDATCGQMSDIISLFTAEECELQRDALDAIAAGCGCVKTQGANIWT